jgi:hypothetical protein
VSEKEKILNLRDGHWVVCESYGRRLLGRMKEKPTVTAARRTEFTVAACEPLYELNVTLTPVTEGPNKGKNRLGFQCLPWTLLGFDALVDVRWSAIAYVHELADGDVHLLRQCVLAAEDHKTSLRMDRAHLEKP